VWPAVIINQFTREFFEANKNHHSKPTRHIVHLCWQFPPKNWHKLNVDGSWHKDLGIMCAGGVIRNDKGDWVSGFSVNLGAGQVLEAELWGLLKGMGLAWNNGCRFLEIEMDSLVAVQLVNSSINPLHPLFRLVANCQELLERDWCVVLSHVYRELNSVADMMARLSHIVDYGCRLFSSPPQEVIKLLEADHLGLAKPRLVLC
jgi:ribonuclease HI